MIYGEIFRQNLQMKNEHVVADTIDYLEAKFIFKTDDWDGLEKWAHFAQGDTVYDIRLTDDCIRKEDHLNLSAGTWKVYLHGNEFADGEVVQRVTTDAAHLIVRPTGTLDGEPFPEIPASVTEQILARLDELEEGGTGGNLPITGAAAGDFLRVSAVDENGVPAAWETITLETLAQLIAEIIGTTPDKIAISYDETTGELTITGSGVTCNEETGELTVPESAAAYDETTGELTIGG